MTMLDPIQDDGDTVMATKSQQEGQDGTSLQANKAATSQSADAPRIEIQASGTRRTKISPTAQYDTDRYRLARPFTTRL